MRKFFIAFFICSAFLFFSPQQTFAPVNCNTERCAECDACGYCQGKEEPQAWKDCKVCLYPSASDKANDNDTLKIETSGANANNPPKPAQGRYYTQIGCINTTVESFTNPSAAGGVVDFLLNKIIFRVVGGLAFLYLLYGAFIVATSQANPEKLREGKSIVIGSITGLVFTLLVVFLVNIIAGQALRIPGFGG